MCNISVILKRALARIQNSWKAEQQQYMFTSQDVSRNTFNFYLSWGAITFIILDLFTFIWSLKKCIFSHLFVKKKKKRIKQKKQGSQEEHGVAVQTTFCRPTCFLSFCRLDQAALSLTLANPTPSPTLRKSGRSALTKLCNIEQSSPCCSFWSYRKN